MIKYTKKKNQAAYIVFMIYDKNGDPVTGATGLDSEIDSWSDASAPTGFTDCTNEAVEIGTSGIYYLLLTADEMDDDYIVIQIKTTSADAKTQYLCIETMGGDPRARATVNTNVAIDVSGLNTLSGHDPGEDLVGISDVSGLSTFNPASDQVIVGTNNDKTGYALTAAGIDAILDEVVSGTFTMRQILGMIGSMAAAKMSGGGTNTLVIRDLADTKDLFTLTIDDDKNRISVAYNL